MFLDPASSIVPRAYKHSTFVVEMLLISDLYAPRRQRTPRRFCVRAGEGCEGLPWELGTPGLARDFRLSFIHASPRVVVGRSGVMTTHRHPSLAVIPSFLGTAGAFGAPPPPIPMVPPNPAGGPVGRVHDVSLVRTL